jgi:hypothetical protein
MLQAALARERELRKERGPPSGAAQLRFPESDEKRSERTKACFRMRKLFHPEDAKYKTVSPANALKTYDTDKRLSVPRRAAAFLKLVLMDRFVANGRGGYAHVDPAKEMKALLERFENERSSDSVAYVASLLKGLSAPRAELLTGYVACRSAQNERLDDEGLRSRAEDVLRALSRRGHVALAIRTRAEAYRILWRRGLSEKKLPLCTHVVDVDGVKEEELPYEEALSVLQEALRSAGDDAGYPKFSRGALFLWAPRSSQHAFAHTPSWLLGETLRWTGDDWVVPGLAVALASRHYTKEWAQRMVDRAWGLGIPGWDREDLPYAILSLSPDEKLEIDQKYRLHDEQSLRAAILRTGRNVTRACELLKISVQTYVGKKAAKDTYVEALNASGGLQDLPRAAQASGVEDLPVTAQASGVEDLPVAAQASGVEDLPKLLEYQEELLAIPVGEGHDRHEVLMQIMRAYRRFQGTEDLDKTPDGAEAESFQQIYADLLKSRRARHEPSPHPDKSAPPPAAPAPPPAPPPVPPVFNNQTKKVSCPPKEGAPPSSECVLRISRPLTQNAGWRHALTRELAYSSIMSELKLAPHLYEGEYNENTGRLTMVLGKVGHDLHHFIEKAQPNVPKKTFEETFEAVGDVIFSCASLGFFLADTKPANILIADDVSERKKIARLIDFEYRFVSTAQQDSPLKLDNETLVALYGSSMVMLLYLHLKSWRDKARRGGDTRVLDICLGLCEKLLKRYAFTAPPVGKIQPTQRDHTYVGSLRRLLKSYGFYSSEDPLRDFWFDLASFIQTPSTPPSYSGEHIKPQILDWSKVKDNSPRLSKYVRGEVDRFLREDPHGSHMQKK